MDKILTIEKLLVGGDFNSHVGSDMDGFGEVQGGFRLDEIETITFL